MYQGLAGGALYSLMAREFAPWRKRLESATRADGEAAGAARGKRANSWCPRACPRRTRKRTQGRTPA